MDDVRWFQIRSWHILRTPTRVPDRYRAVCGKTGHGPVLDNRPQGRTCESCYRIAGPK